MKLTVKQSNLVKALTIVNKAVNPRVSLPMLANVLMRTEKGRLKLTASDLQTTISVWLGAKIDEQGEYTVPAKILTEFVTQVKDETIDFALTGAILKASTSKAKANFSGMPAHEFPSIEADTQGQTIKLKSKDFLDAVSKIVFTVATDESRPILTGIYLKAQNNLLTIAATDGFRMAEYKLDLNELFETEVKCVIPGKYLADVVKAFAPASEEIVLNVNMDRNVATIKVEDMEAQIRLLEGDFPDYEAIIPESFTSEMKFMSSELGSALKLASIFSRESGNMIKITGSDEKMEVLSQPTEAGSNTVAITGDFTGDEIQIAFNAKYILDFVNNIEDTELSFNTLESLKPGLFKITENPNYFYLVMPMRANW